MSKYESPYIDFVEAQDKSFIDRKIVDHCLISWSIHNFRKLLLVNTTSISSPPFYINSESWIITLFPLYLLGSGTLIKLHLIRNESRNPVQVTLRFGIKKSSTTWLEEKRKIEVPVEGENFAICDTFEYFDTEDNLKDNNTFTVLCEMYIAFTTDELFPEIHSLNAMQSANLSLDIFHQYGSANHSDVIIRGKNLHSFAHKAILSSRSPVFAKMLKKNCSSVDIPDDDCIHIPNLLAYIYSGKFDKLSLSNMCIGLYECATRYEVTGLVQILTPLEINISSTAEQRNFEFTWKIDRFSSYNGLKITSPPFHAGSNNSSTWFLNIYPNGTHMALHHVGIFVKKEAMTSQSAINLTISILDEFQEGHYERHTIKQYYPTFGYGFPDYVTMKELEEKGLLRGDKLIVRCKVAYDVILHSHNKTSLAATSSILEQPFIEQLSRDFEKLLLDGQFSDLSLVSHSDTFRVHKAILAARSPRFRQVIKDSGKEDSMIFIKDVSPVVLEAMIFYAYTGKLKDYNNHFLIDLYSGAEAYCMFDLVYACSVALDSLDKDSIFDVILLAYKYSDECLMKQCLKYLKKIGEKILESKQWDYLVRRDPALSFKLEKWIKSPTNEEMNIN